MATPEEAAEVVKANQEQLERQYQRLFGSEDGRAVLADMAKQCHVFDSTYVPGCTDAMLINEGGRRVFLYIASRIRMEMTEAYVKREKAPAANA